MTGGRVADVLDAAADLLSAPGAWTQGALARNALGKDAKVGEDKVCFCMAGALVETSGPWSAAWAFLDKFLPNVRGANNTAAFNDAPGRTQAEVIAKLREAANAARATGEASHG